MVDFINGFEAGCVSVLAVAIMAFIFAIKTKIGRATIEALAGRDGDIVLFLAMSFAELIVLGICVGFTLAKAVR